VLATVSASSTCGTADARVEDLKEVLFVYKATYCNVM
jgi:hypothetical protein